VWHPNLGALPEGVGHGFATSRWEGESEHSFATDDFGLGASGFMLEARPVSHDELSESAQRALSLLDDVKKQHALAKKALEEQEAASANAHLPFVLDVYEVPAVKSPVQTAPALEDETEDAQVACEDTEPSTQAEPELAAAETDHAGTAQAATEAQAEAQPTQPVAAHVEAEAQTPMPELIAADEASPHGDEQFEKGMALGLEQGTAQGLEKGLQQGLEQGLAEGREQGMKEGLALAEAQALELQAQAEQEAAVTHALLDEVSAKLNALLDDPTQFFEPLKRLALHLAEHVVKCELRTSSHSVEQLIQRCLDDLDHPANGAVVIELHPDDKARLQAQDSALTQGMRLDAVHDMKPGSVRVFANDMIVEDLVEHRLEALARTLLIDVDSWRKQSVLAKPETPEVVPEENQDNENVMQEATDVHP
jgi:flagellar biosynthesis/type III secretory pathway protein FliH